MESLRCYCGIELDPGTGFKHLINCPAWHSSSRLYQTAKEIAIGNSMQLLRLECEALLYANFKDPKKSLPEPPELKFPAKKRSIPLEENKHIGFMQEEAKLFESDAVKCELCSEMRHDMVDMFFPECCHLMCREHAIEAIRAQYPSENVVECPKLGCDYCFAIEEMRDLVGDQELEKLKEESIKDFIETSGGILVNCSCGISSILEPGNVDSSYKDDTGNTISARAARNMSKYRFRCSNCNKVFCAKCKADPYHLGKTCKEYLEFKSSNKCRYCEKQIPPGKKVCKSKECKSRRRNSCRQRLSCGHHCYGVKNEHRCLPCLNENCRDSNNEHDFCSICFIEGLGAAPSVQMICGHIVHYHCLVTQLEKRWVGPRITFNFAKCPSCNEWAHVPDSSHITSLMDSILELFSDIREKALKRLKFEGMENDSRLTTHGDHYYNQREKYALDRLSYYECFKCKKPYFGGKKECEQNLDRDHYDQSELVCPACSAIGMQGTDCPTHGKDFIEFKCKFCCSVSAWFCWGNTHFCDSCHTRQNNGDYLTRKKRDELQKCLGPSKCPLKVKHPPNGEEFALGCAVCRNLKDNYKEF